MVESTTTSTDVTTRIAQNFVQGVRACAAADLVVLGDHDDVWHPSRVAHQVGMLGVWARAAMVASDGVLVDAKDEPVGARCGRRSPCRPDGTP